MLLTIAEIAVLLLVPALMVRLTKRSRFLGSIGAIALCYAFGFLLAVLPIPYDKGLSETVASVLVALAIPLVLFSFDIRSVRKLAKTTLVSFGLVIVSVIAVSTAAAFLGASRGMENVHALSGMATGLYIGGTPNLFAIGSALLGRDSTAINLANIADSLVGGIYFLLILTVIRPVYARVLGTRGKAVFSEAEAAAFAREADSEYDYSRLPKDKKGIARLVGIVLLAAACLGIGVLLEILINGNMDGSLYIMVTVSVLGVALSFVRPVRQTPGTYQVGQYLILVFSLGLSMSIDLHKLVSGLLPTFAYFSGIQIAALLLHFLLCRIFRIDGGTAIITSTAGIYGPPFIAPVANAYGDRSLIVPGVICGTLGLVTGNLFGLALGSILAAIL